MSATPIEWDEVGHFNGAMLLLHSNLNEYLISSAFYPPMYDFRADGKTNSVYQYPEDAADAYTPDFSAATFVSQCREYNVKYVLMYEYGADVNYFNTTVTTMDIYMQLDATGDFGNLPTMLSNGTVVSRTVFGTSPSQIYVITFLG